MRSPAELRRRTERSELSQDECHPMAGDPEIQRIHRDGIVMLLERLAFLIPLALGVVFWGESNGAITMAVAIVAAVATHLFFRRRTARPLA